MNNQMETALIISLTGHTVAKREEDPLDVFVAVPLSMASTKDAIGEISKQM